ncbi:DUF4157 domain-containing protein [Streptomyces roseifaciens]
MGLRTAMEWRLEGDFIHVRVHTDEAAARTARALGADAFTVGPHIVFGRNRWAPGTPAGDRLLAHELVHTTQQPARSLPPELQVAPAGSPAEHEAERRSSRTATRPGRPAMTGHKSGPLVQRSPETAGGGRAGAFWSAVNSGAWPEAVAELAALPPDEAKALLALATPRAREQLHRAAARLDPSSANTLVPLIEAAEQKATATEQKQQQAVPTAPDVSSLSSGEKLSLAWQYAPLGEDVVKELKELITPRSLAAMGVFAAVYIAAQLTPAGWVADAVALTALTISFFFVGSMLLDVTRDLYRFFKAVDATTDSELRQAGYALSRALAKGGVALVMALLTKCLRKSGGGGSGRPYEAPPEPGFGDLVTNEGLIVRAPVAAAEEAVAASPGRLQQAASYAVAAPPPGGPKASEASGGRGPTASGSPSSGGGKAAGPGAAPRIVGPEIWEELSRELGNEPATGSRTPGGTAGAVRSAEEGGLIGPKGKPGAVDLGVQPHKSASEVREAQGVKGADVQSAHIAPSGFVGEVPGYSRSLADTTLLPKAIHAHFDAYWKRWAMEQRKTRTTCTVRELNNIMLDAIQQTKGIEQRAKNALAWRLHLELFRDLGLSPEQQVNLPYKNIPTAPQK